MVVVEHRDPPPGPTREVLHRKSCIESRATLNSASAEPAEEPQPHQPVEDEELVSWVRVAAAAADDKLGQRTDAFYVGGVLAITDWFVVTSGRNHRQVRAIVEAVEEALRRAGGPKPTRIEGSDTYSWVLMDYGFLVIHVFTEEAREHYDLERLWRDVPRLNKTA